MMPALFTVALLVLAHGSEAASFIQTRRALTVAGAAPGDATCTPLTNHGTHFTVDIEVGTPGQKFSVVADTGSNSLIIPSCICQQQNFCSKSDRCFTGTNTSTSFALKEGPSGPQSIFITFGSGTIEAVVAEEKVTIGHLDVNMKDGLLLMVARKLDIAGRFEGILGLGVPEKAEHQRAAHKRHVHKDAGVAAQIKDIVKKVIGGIFGDNHQRDQVRADDTAYAHKSETWDVDALPMPDDDQLSAEIQNELDDLGDMIQDQDTMDNPRMGYAPANMAGLSRDGARDWLKGMRHNENPQQISGPKGLLEQANVSRFSMCFNDGSPGVLSFNAPEMPDSLGSVGEFHWGLDFRGITIGDTVAPLSFCSGENLTDGQETACGAIPDSGTTVIMAPKEHLSMLLDSICDQWPRCAQNYTAMVKAAEAAKQGATAMYSWDPFEIAPASKSAILQLLLLDCGSWLDEGTGLNELPSLKFHVAGSNGQQKMLELPGWAYVLESTHSDAEMSHQFRGLEGDTSFLQNFVLQSNKVCSPAFGTMDYNTQKNGPVWILGTPFFYEFHVGYDLDATPPSISFTSTKTSPCVSCGQTASLLDPKSNSSRHKPRWVSGPLRIPDMDMDLPL